MHASVDCLCVLALTGGGDELQAVKRGLLELADVLAVNKADGDNEQAARLAAAEFRRALPLLVPTGEDGPPPVLTISAATGAGVDELWDSIVEHRRLLDVSGGLARRRAGGRLAWMRVLLERRLQEQFEAQPGLAERRAHLEQAVERDEITPESAVDQLLSLS